MLRFRGSLAEPLCFSACEPAARFPLQLVRLLHPLYAMCFAPVREATHWGLVSWVLLTRHG